MATRRYYDPGSVNSSPYEPAMGQNAIYRHPRIGQAKAEAYPAIITHVYTEAEHKESFNADAVDLCVFTPRGMQFVTRVKFSMDIESSHTWDWVPELERRAVQNPETRDTADIKSTPSGEKAAGAHALKLLAKSGK